MLYSPAGTSVKGEVPPSGCVSFALPRNRKYFIMSSGEVHLGELNVVFTLQVKSSKKCAKRSCSPVNPGQGTRSRQRTAGAMTEFVVGPGAALRWQQEQQQQQVQWKQQQWRQWQHKTGTTTKFPTSAVKEIGPPVGRGERKVARATEQLVSVPLVGQGERKVGRATEQPVSVPPVGQERTMKQPQPETVAKASPPPFVASKQSFAPPLPIGPQQEQVISELLVKGAELRNKMVNSLTQGSGRLR